MRKTFVILFICFSFTASSQNVAQKLNAAVNNFLNDDCSVSTEGNSNTFKPLTLPRLITYKAEHSEIFALLFESMYF